MFTRPFIGALLLWFLLELPLVTDGMTWVWYGAAVVCAAVFAWYSAQRIRVAILGALCALLAILFLTMVSGSALYQWTAGVAAVMFGALLFAAERHHATLLALVSLCEVAGFYFLVLFATLIMQMPTWVAMLAMVSVSSVLFFTSLSVTLALSVGMEMRLMLFSAVVGLVSAELFVALSRLPFNMVSIDFLMFIIYYGAWDIVARYFSLRFTKRSLALHAAFIMVAFLGVFLSSR
ncbi:MAG: hypothetical protein AAB581_00080 [Patescibacteria group bacterium]